MSHPPLPEDLAAFAASTRGGDGVFANPWGANPARTPLDILRWKAAKNPFAESRRLPKRLPVAPHPLDRHQELDEAARLMWLGHASLLVEIDGVRVLIDPLFGKAGPVVPRAVPAPLLPAALPRIDAVCISHGHYDHLDAGSLRAIAKRFPEATFLVPLGVERYLPAEARKVVALDWWASASIGGIQAHFVPAQHWHRRGPFDHNQALWGGWVLRGRRSVYHSGDTGFFGGFRAIGERFPGLDVAILPLGAWAPRWFMREQHMDPGESVQAWRDCGAARFVGMHWGTYDLTDEPLDFGAQVSLPGLIEEQGLDGSKVHVLAHGGSLAFGDRPAVSGGAEVERLAGSFDGPC